MNELAERVSLLLKPIWRGVEAALVEGMGENPRCRLGRFALRGGQGTPPAAVVVRHAKPGARAVFGEWAATRFLTRHHPVPGIGPGFLAGDEAAGLLVVEDIGPADERLGRVLQGDDAAAATRGLVELCRTLARLHAGSMGLMGEYRAVAAAVGPLEPTHHRANTLAEGLDALPGLCASLGYPVPPAAARELDEAKGPLLDPGPLLAFTHGDATPLNAHYSRGRVRLVDFESGGWRNALVDGSYPRLRYLHTSWAGAIPPALRREAERAYRETLAEGCPAAGDDGLYHTAHVACAAAWTAGLCAFIPRVLHEDEMWNIASRRARILCGLEDFADLAEEYRRLPALAEFCRGLNGLLREKWGGPAGLPLYAALAR